MKPTAEIELQDGMWDCPSIWQNSSESVSRGKKNILGASFFLFFATSPRKKTGALRGSKQNVPFVTDRSLAFV